MPVRSLVCLTSGEGDDAAAVEAALVLAERCGAYLRVVHVLYQPSAYTGIYGEAVVLGGGWQQAVDRENDARRQETQQLTEAMFADHKIPLGQPQPAAAPHGTFVALENVTNSALVRYLSLCDLIVIAAPTGSAQIVDQSVVDLALFGTGRPVLFVRPGADAGAQLVDGRCAIAWSNTPEAIKAVINALPLIRAASAVHAIVATSGQGSGKGSGQGSGEGSGEGSEPTSDQAGLLDYLRAHDVEADLSIVAPGQGGEAQAVLDEASRLGCSYLVMGAYGHSRFRETLLGGFSRHMLSRASLPLIMSH